MGIELLPDWVRTHYDVHEWKHACAILQQDFPQEWADLLAALSEFRLLRSHIASGGGNKSQVASALDSALYRRGWQERHFETRVTVDAHEYDSPTHAVDCFKNKVALEVEWNNMVLRTALAHQHLRRHLQRLADVEHDRDRHVHNAGLVLSERRARHAQLVRRLDLSEMQRPALIADAGADLLCRKHQSCLLHVVPAS
jgi:hypothetical protein